MTYDLRRLSLPPTYRTRAAYASLSRSRGRRPTRRPLRPDRCPRVSACRVASYRTHRASLDTVAEESHRISAHVEAELDVFEMEQVAVAPCASTWSIPSPGSEYGLNRESRCPRSARRRRRCPSQCTTSESPPNSNSRSVASKNSGLNETCSSQPKTSRLIHPTGAREVKCSLPLSAPDVVPIGSEAPPQTAETRSASGSASLPPVLACPPSRGLDISEGEPNRSHKTCLIRDDLRLRRCLGSQSALEPRALSSEAPPPASTSSFVNLWRWHPRQNLGRITRVRGVQALNRPNLTKVRACVNSRQPLAL